MNKTKINFYWTIMVILFIFVIQSSELLAQKKPLKRKLKVTLKNGKILE